MYEIAGTINLINTRISVVGHEEAYSLNFIKKKFLDKLFNDGINILSEKRANIMDSFCFRNLV